MALTLYELDGRDGHRFSPYCWRILMALEHKRLTYERVPMRFTDRACIAASGQDRVPVLADDGHIVSDSWTIAGDLEDRYGDRPSLFGCAIGRGEALFLNRWVDLVVHAALRMVVIPDVWEHVHADDSIWFKADRERMLGMSFEAVRAGQALALERFQGLLQPLRAVLADQPYLCGEAPAYGDYILFGTFQWARCSSPVTLLTPDDPVAAWRRRMLALFDGFAAAAPGYAAE